MIAAATWMTNQYEFSAGTSSSTPTTAESSDTTSSAPVESTEPSTEPSDDVTAEPSEAVAEPMESASAPEEAGKADPDEIATLDALTVFDKIGLVEHLSAQRANGLRSMIKRIKQEARAVYAP